MEENGQKFLDKNWSLSLKNMVSTITNSKLLQQRYIQLAALRKNIVRNQNTTKYFQVNTLEGFKKCKFKKFSPQKGCLQIYNYKELYKVVVLQEIVYICSVLTNVFFVYFNKIVSFARINLFGSYLFSFSDTLMFSIQQIFFKNCEWVFSVVQMCHVSEIYFF